MNKEAKYKAKGSHLYNSRNVHVKQTNIDYLPCVQDDL